GDRALACTPREMLHHHPILGTFDAPRRVAEPRRNGPQRDKAPPPLWQLVITRCGLAAHRAFAADCLMRLDGNLQVELALEAPQADIRINEAEKRLNLVQNGFNFQLHGWSLGLTCSIDLNTDRITEDQLFFHPICPFGFQAPGLVSCHGSGDKALQECNLSTESSVDCIDCIRPVWAKSRTGFLVSFWMPLQPRPMRKTHRPLNRRARITPPPT